MKKEKTEKKHKHPRHPVATVFSACSMCLLVLLVVVCVPLTVPRFFGVHIYSVVSGSMEPAIPTGSLIYIAEALPEEIQEEEIIAFYGVKDSASIITHRVMENRVVMGEFITKGDANKTQDMNPVPYENFIGKVIRSVPKAGKAAELFTSHQGKVLAACVIGAALLLQAIAALIERTMPVTILEREVVKGRYPKGAL